MQIKNILSRAKRKPFDKLNILTINAHERFETNWAKTGHNFYGMTGYQGTKSWSTKYANVPPNYTLLDSNGQLPADLSIDCVVCHSKSHYQILSQWSNLLQVPLICIEHCIPPPLPNVEDYIEQCKPLVGDINAYITKGSITRWGHQENSQYRSIYHGIDTELFYIPTDDIRINEVLCVMNDVRGRSLEMGGDHFMLIQNSLKNRVKLVGDNGDLGKAAESTEALIKEYQSAKIFLNTTASSTIPMSLLEAASCGCAIVCRPTGCIPEFFKHTVNAIFYEYANDAIGAINHLIYNNTERIRLGKAAQDTVKSVFQMDRFINQWNQVFEDVRVLCK